jgi:hypothetical protein
MPEWRKPQPQQVSKKSQQARQHGGSNNDKHNNLASGRAARKTLQHELDRARENKEDESGRVRVVVAGRMPDRPAASGTPGTSSYSGGSGAIQSQDIAAHTARESQQEEGPLTTKSQAPCAANRTSSGGRGAGAGTGTGALSTGAAAGAGSRQPAAVATGPAGGKPAPVQAPTVAGNGPPGRLTRGGTFEEAREDAEADAGVFTDSDDSGDEVLIVVASDMHRKTAGARAASNTSPGDWHCEMCRFPSNRRDMSACVLCGAPPPCAKLDIGQIALASDDHSVDAGVAKSHQPEDDDAAYRDDFDEG